MSDAVSRPGRLAVPFRPTWASGTLSRSATALWARFVPRERATPPAGVLIVAVLVVLGVGALMPAQPPSTPPEELRVVAAPPPTWIEIGKPVQIFSLEAPALSHDHLAYTARRWSTGEGREDMMAFGTFGDSQPMLRLNLRTGEHRESANVPLFAAMARQAADADLSVERSGLPGLLPTRFGRFEIADVNLSGGGTPAQTMPCHGFRLVLDQPELSISGLACGAFKAFSRNDLTCLVDRLDLASGGGDKPLVDFFAASELRRNPDCAGTRLGPDHLHAAWLDDKPATPRKHSRRH